MLANPKRYRAWLLQRGETVVGYALYAQVLDEAELLRIGVRPDSQGQGVITSYSIHYTKLYD